MFRVTYKNYWRIDVKMKIYRLNGWKTVSLCDIAEISMGQSPPSEYYNNENLGLPFLQGVTNFGDRFPKVTIYCTKEQKVANPGDILFSVRAPVGRINLAPEKLIIGRGLAAIKSKHNQQHFLFYALKNHFYKEDLIGTGAIFAAIKKDDLSNIEIQIPEDLKIQKKISSILKPYDDLIEINQYRIKLLEEAARLLYQEWFVRLRFPGHEHTKIVDGVPEGWKSVHLHDVANITMGQSPASSYYNHDGIGLPFHQGVRDYGNRFPTNTTYCSKEFRIAEAGDILFSVRAPVGRINITLDRIVIGRGLASIRSKANCQEFLFYCLKNIFFKDDLMGTGAIYAAITKKELTEYCLLYPSNLIIESFIEYVKPIDQMIISLHMSNRNLINSRDLLLPRLMNGVIPV